MLFILSYFEHVCVFFLVFSWWGGAHDVHSCMEKEQDGRSLMENTIVRINGGQMFVVGCKYQCKPHTKKTKHLTRLNREKVKYHFVQ